MDIRIKRLPNESRFLLLSYSELSFSRHYSFIDSQESWIYLQLVETCNWLISNCLTICIHLYTKQDKVDLSTQLTMLDTCQDRNFYFKKTFPRVQGHTDWCTLTVDSYRAFLLLLLLWHTKGITIPYKRLFWDLSNMFSIMGVKMIDYVNFFVSFIINN